MKGSVHAAIGASTPVALVLTQHASIIQGAIMSAVAAGYSLLPDVDSPDTCASTALGPVAHKSIQGMARVAVDATSLPRDMARTEWMKARGRNPYHRTLTHTAVAAFAVSVTAFWLAWLHPAAAGGVAALGVFLLWPLRKIPVGVLVFGAAASAVGAAMLLTPWLLAVAVGCGYATHVAGDSCTKAGVPAFWPIAIQGKRWWSFRLLSGLIESGSARERVPALGVAVVSNAFLLLMNL